MKYLIPALLLLIPDPPALIVEDECDFIEVNSIYQNGSLFYRQVIFWEFGWVQKEYDDGLTRRTWGKRVKDYVSYNTHQGRDFQHRPQRDDKGWYCEFFHTGWGPADEYRIKIRASFMIETHTDYDPEQKNLKILPRESRTGFKTP